MSNITILLTQPSGTTLPAPTSHRRMTPIIPPSPDASILHAPQVLMVRTPRSRPKRRESLPAHVPRPEGADEERGRTPRVARVPRSPRSFDLSSSPHPPSGGRLTPPPLPPRPQHKSENLPPITVTIVRCDEHQAERRGLRERPRGRQRPSTVDAGAPGLATVVECARDAPYPPMRIPAMTVGGPRNSGYSGTCSRSKL